MKVQFNCDSGANIDSSRESGWFDPVDELGLDEGELDEFSTTEDYSVVRQEGSRQVKRKLKHYNLDAIISVGYRVQSHVATRFRQWATQHLREFIVKGFVLDDERLKNPDQPFDYFEELTRRIHP
jgi:hypothetical protein